MTRVQLWRNKAAHSFSCKAAGHAGFASKGSDIVCAAETILLRTAMRVLEESGMCFSANETKRGFLEFMASVPSGSAVDSESALVERLFCVADFLATGLKSLEVEYPLHIAVEELIEQ